MGHIQQGDIRQYFSQNLPEIDYSGQYANILNSGLHSGVSIAQKANESALANNQIDLSAKFLAENNKINTKYQADPTNPQREVELQQAFESLASQYKINPIVQKQWTDIKSNVYNRYKMYNAQWAENQQKTNIQTNLKNGYESLINQISMLGYNGADIDQMKLIYANGIEGLRNSAVAGLGEVFVNDFLKDSNHDIMTTYVSSLAQNNPLAAQALLKHEDVRNDIGRAETLEKLDAYVATSLSNQAKRTAVNELGDTLRAMNSDDADNIINGKADLNQVMKFVETNKGLHEGSKDFILGIYGIGSTTEYIYDKDKKRILKKEDAGSGSRSRGRGSARVIKMSQIDKRIYAESLEEDLHDLISFSEENLGKIEAKKAKNEDYAKDASDFSIGYMKRVADMQEQIDAACAAGVITKNDRKRMMNQYIAPVVDYIDSNLSQLDEKSLVIAGNKLGYDKIKQAFNTEGLNGEELKDMQRQKLFAQNYYLDELNQVVAEIPNLKNIYQIETLPPNQQQAIYKRAANNALERAQRWTDKPELFFAKEYPATYSEPFKYFKKEQAAEINRFVAEKVFERKFQNPDGTSKIDLQDFANNEMKIAINNTAKKNRIQAGNTLQVLKEHEATISMPDPKNINEFYQRIKALGITPEKFMNDARQRGFLKKTIGQRIQAANRAATGKSIPMEEYFFALREAEAAKARKNQRK